MGNREWSEFLKVCLALHVDITCTANFTAVLKAEVETCMRLLGVEKVNELGPQHVSCQTLSACSLLIVYRSILDWLSRRYTTALQIYHGPSL